MVALSTIYIVLTSVLFPAFPAPVVAHFLRYSSQELCSIWPAKLALLDDNAANDFTYHGNRRP